MPKWTENQELAINETGKNILVSAGAGSGKTAVLTERVIRKLKNGISIKNMLILTFTNNAAHEMKERIRKSIKEASLLDKKLKKELDYIDNAYITTFDSFALSLVKRYHYILDIGNDINIIDSSIIDLKREEILDDIFDELYKDNNKDFLNLVDLLCTKDDDNLKSIILEINKKINLLVNKEDYLNNYIEEHYDDVFINSIINDYEQLLIDKINEINNLLNDLSNEVDSNYIENCYLKLNDLLNSKTYESIKVNSDIKLDILRNSSVTSKDLKSEITSTIKEINNMCYYSKDEIKRKLLSTKSYCNEIVSIIKTLDKRVDNFKHNINKYEFIDISLMAIDLVKNNPFIKNELINNFKEICVDEYQDTNDIQEEFIFLIGNNNIYMVGDIKQSIYRFRNANPILFKNKYEMFSKKDNGIKIDLVKNFRSRSEVIDNINLMFNLIMDNNIGGANYKESHNMIFGNNTYDNEGKTNQNNNMEILNYEFSKDLKYKKEEIEAFIIAEDIKNKINNKYKIFNKDTKTLENANYNDFVILMDRTTSFETYKKIFEYLNIPTTLYMDENIVNEDELLIIKNIVNLIIKIKLEEYDVDFKYSFISIARSYLFSISDNDIFNIFKNNTFKETNLYKICYEISNEIDSINNTTLLELIVDKFDFINNLIKVHDIDNKIAIIDYLYNNFKDLDSIGYGIYELNNYLDIIIKNNKEIKISTSTTDNNSVKIMTIHKSKGLEYNICYYSGYDKKFNLSDLKSRIVFDNKYGIVTPIEDDGLEELITKVLIKNNYIKDDISERIRLLYVALTRAKEKIIIVGDFNEDKYYSKEISGIIENRTRNKYRSFKDIIISIKSDISNYFVNVDLNKIKLTHEYNNIKDYNYKDLITSTSKSIEVKKIVLDKVEYKSNHYSKESLDLVNEDIYNYMNTGTYLHELFECIDFKNPDFTNISDNEKQYIINFLNQKIFNNIKDAKIYKEYEFIYDNKDKLHGIIDLMLEYNDYIDIVDYKLKNTISDEYINQLNGYKEYITILFNKHVNIYLYSILNNELKKL